MSNNLVFFENNYESEENGNKFIAIDGFPADENEEGDVIAVVWLTPHRDIVVDWHNNGYRRNKTCLELIENAKERLLGFRLDRNKKGVKNMWSKSLETFNPFQAILEALEKIEK